jgi:RNA polymerase sigma factor (sigma-70 family)
MVSSESGTSGLRGFKSMSHGSRRAADVVEDFFEARGADLLTFLRRRLRCDADAHDIAQETYLRFIRLGKPEQIQNAESYVFRIASNLLWEHRLREGPAQYSGNPTEEIADDCTALDLAASEERGARIRKVLDDLPAVPRAVLILHLRDGLTCPEIGARCLTSTISFVVLPHRGMLLYCLKDSVTKRL